VSVHFNGGNLKEMKDVRAEIGNINQESKLTTIVEAINALDIHRGA
jgi:hypothetical protein